MMQLLYWSSAIVVIGLAAGLFSVVHQYKKTTYYQVNGNSYFSVIFDLGKYGGYLTYKYLRAYEEKGTKFLYNCYLPRENDDTTEIDVLMIYKSGLYVFESKSCSFHYCFSERCALKKVSVTSPNVAAIRGDNGRRTIAKIDFGIADVLSSNKVLEL